VNATCLSCHSKGEHEQWQGSMHDARNLSCTTCHSVHSPKSEKAQLKTADATGTCVTCHKNEAMKLQRSGHMPLREGKMECTSCHNPHGSTNVRLLKTGNWINESCTSCHTEKRGPFLWEHSAGRESCASCHDPHGSNNDRMLVAKLPMLCQRCHVSSRHPATMYDGAQLTAASNRLVGRGCVNCHAQIHGSNSPAGDKFLR
jgi:DmsE family decaheme c-type cytochrome